MPLCSEYFLLPSRGSLEVEKTCAFGRTVIYTWVFCEVLSGNILITPFKTAKKLEEIRNFKQDMNETLYQAWERYNDLLFKCPQHDLNNHQNVQIFYTRLDISTRKLLDSRGFITLMTPTQSLKSIQVMADYPHDCGKAVEQSNSIWDPWRKPSSNFTKIQLKNRPQMMNGLGSKKVKARTTMGKENVKEPVPRDLSVVQTYVPLMPFLGDPYRTRKTICAIGIPEEIQEDEGYMNDGCDITVEDVERLRKILTPSIHTLPKLKPIVQPYMPLGLVCNKAKVVREEEQDYDITLQDHHLNEFREAFADNTRVFEKIDSNTVNDLKDLLRTYDFETFIRKLQHQVSQSSHKTSSHSKEMESEVISTQIHVLVQVDTHGVVLGLYLATGKHFKSGLVGYHADDDDVLELWMLLMEVDLKHGLEHVVFSSSRANPGEINKELERNDVKNGCFY
ncbi:hypothetical protein Tco_0694208 [Tanacetum coccineum]